MVATLPVTDARKRADALRGVLDSRWKVFSHPDFDRPKMERKIVADMPDLASYEAKRGEVKKLRLANTDSEILPFYQEPLLSKAQEQHLFRKMNFFKYKLEKTVRSLHPSHPSLVKLGFAEYLNVKRNAVKQHIVCCNTRLASQVLRRYGDYCRQRGLATDMLSEAYLNIVRAVDCFDWTRGFKFSTYATWVLINNFSRDLSGERKFTENFVTGFDESIYDDKEDNRDEVDRVYTEKHEDNKVRAEKLIGLLDKPEDERKRSVIERFFGIGGEKKTLLQISEEMGLTKERVRQLRERGLEEIRERMAEMGWTDELN
jgi:RNA polymerase sigma factor (sigma-70 family)